MNFLKKILGFSTNEQNPSDSSQDIFSFVGEGKLLGYSNGEKQEIFSLASIRFLANPDKMFSYTIYVKNIGQANPEMAPEYIFPIYSNMNLKSIYENEEDEETITFLWNLDPNNSLCFIFHNLNNGLPKAVIFKEFLCRLIFETINGKSSLNASKDSEFLKYCKELECPKDLVPKLEIKPKAQAKPEELIDLSIVLPEFTKKKSTLLCNSGSHFSLDDKEALNLLNPSIIFVLSDDNDFKYSFSLYNSQKKLLYKKSITSELNYHIDEEQNLFKWLDFSNSSLQLLAIKFNSYGLTKNLKFLMNQCLFETNRKEYLKDAIKKGDELDFAQKFMGQESMEIEQEVIKEFRNDPEIKIQGRYSSIRNNDQLENKTFSQAMFLDRTFLSKGDVVSVFKTEEDNEDNLEFICNLPGLKTIDNKPLIPKKLLLHQEDSKVLILNENDNKKVFYLDLERGKVVSELQPDDSNSILDICPESKHSNLTNNQIFLGLNKKNLFKLDPRLNPKKAAASSKIYSTNNHFNSIATNKNGNFVVGNDLGELRLYKEVGQNAKNLYPGLGDPIISIDCTKDGRWLLATCKNYLLFVPAFHSDRNAFQSTIKNIDKPTPRMLKIHPKDMVILGIKEVNFVNGRFDDLVDEKEQYIVVGCDCFIFTWSLKKVLQGKIFDYDYKRLEDRIVNNEFKFNTDKLLIALPEEMRLHQTITSKN